MATILRGELLSGCWGNAAGFLAGGRLTDLIGCGLALTGSGLPPNGSSLAFTGWTLAKAAALSLLINSSLIFSISREIAPEGLGTKSTAPRAKASMVALAPEWVTLLSITTGTGLLAMMSRSVSSPSLRGISTSRVITWGLFSLIFSTAK